MVLVLTGSLWGAEGLPAQHVHTLPLTEVTAPVAEGGAGSGLDRTVLSGEDLDLFQAESLADLSLITPNLFFSSSDTRGYGDVVTMRGQGNTLFFGAPAVGLYVDDVPFSDAFAYPGELLRLESVNVLFGPQGSAYGRNAPGGLIEITTLRPAPELHFGGRIEAGSYDSVALSGFSSGPIGGDFSHTLQVYYKQRDGFLDNPFLGTRPDDRSVAGALGTLVWTPRDDLEVKLRLAAERVRDGAQRLSPLPSFFNPNPDPFEVNSNIPGQNDIDRYQLSLHATKQFDWGRAKSITAYQNWDLGPQTTDLDLSPAPYASSLIYQDQSFFTQEFRFESPADAGPLTWRGGLFYMHKETSGDGTRRFPDDPFNPMPNILTERTVFDIDEDNLALFGRGAYALGNGLTLEAGARLDYTEVSMRRRKPVSPAPFPIPDQDLSSDEFYFSPTAGLIYEFNEKASAFVRSGIGIKPRGFSAFSDNPALAAFDSERNWSNEIGVRFDCRENNLNIVVRAFWNLIDDYQLNAQNPASTDFIVLNAEEVTSRGIEAEARWQPLGGLMVLGSFGWTQAEFDTFNNPFHDPLNPFSGPADYNGNRVPYIPEFTASGGLRYEFPMGFFAATSVTASGETFYDSGNAAAFRENGFVVWDAQVGYRRENWSVTLFGRNLLDEEYYTFMNPGINAGSPGNPQVFGVRVDFDVW